MIQDCIIITKSFESASLVAALFGRNLSEDNKSFYGHAKSDYNKKWVWLIKNNSYSGSSGYLSLENYIEQNPDLKIISDY